MTRRRSLQTAAYDHLKRMIYSAELQFGVIYSETKLAGQLAISRTPIRDALNRLAHERYIDILPNRGFQLHLPNATDLREAYHVRLMIEGYCTELLARIRALTRRRGDHDVQVVTFEDLSLDQGTHDLSCDSRTGHLSQKEFEVMKLLMETNGVVSKQRLIDSVWGKGDDVSENSAEAYISFLRKKLSHLDSRSQITTLRMLGYRLEASDGRVTMR